MEPGRQADEKEGAAGEVATAHGGAARGCGEAFKACSRLAVRQAGAQGRVPRRRPPAGASFPAPSVHCRSLAALPPTPHGTGTARSSALSTLLASRAVLICASRSRLRLTPELLTPEAGRRDRDVRTLFADSGVALSPVFRARPLSPLSLATYRGTSADESTSPVRSCLGRISSSTLLSLPLSFFTRRHCASVSS